MKGASSCYPAWAGMSLCLQLHTFYQQRFNMHRPCIQWPKTLPLSLGAPRLAQEGGNSKQKQ